MDIRATCFLLGLLSTGFANGQAVRVDWWRGYSLGAVNAPENLASVALGTNDTIATTGTSNLGAGFQDDLITTVHRASTGLLLWRRSWDGGNSQDSAKGVKVDHAGNVIVLGRRGTADGGDFLVLKYSPSGSLLWWRQVNSGLGADDPTKLLVEPDGRIIAVGSAGPIGRQRAFAVGLDANLAVRWTETYDYGAGTSTTVLDAVRGPGTDLYLTGTSTPVPGVGGSRLFVHKHRADTGSLLWNRWIQRSQGLATRGTGLSASQSAVFVAGTGIDQSLGSVALLYSLNAGTGVPNWGFVERSTPSTGQHEDGRSLVGIDLGGNLYWVAPVQGAGTNQRDISLRGVTPQGAYRWQTWFNAGSNVSDTPIDLILDQAGRAYILSRVQFPSQAPRTGILAINTLGNLRWWMFLNLQLAQPMEPSGIALDAATGDLGASLPFYRNPSNSAIVALYRQAPEAVNNAYIVTNKASTKLAVLDNDRYAKGSALTIAKAPNVGTASVNADGTITYSPKAGHVGTASFQYRLTKTNLTPSVATVNLTIRP